MRNTFLATFSSLPSGSTRFYWVLLGFTGFYWVLLGFTGFYRVLLGFTGFYRVLSDGCDLNRVESCAGRVLRNRKKKRELVPSNMPPPLPPHPIQSRNPKIDHQTAAADDDDVEDDDDEFFPPFF